MVCARASEGQNCCGGRSLNRIRCRAVGRYTKRGSEVSRGERVGRCAAGECQRPSQIGVTARPGRKGDASAGHLKLRECSGIGRNAADRRRRGEIGRKIKCRQRNQPAAWLPCRNERVAARGGAGDVPCGPGAGLVGQGAQRAARERRSGNGAAAGGSETCSAPDLHCCGRICSTHKRREQT